MIFANVKHNMFDLNLETENTLNWTFSRASIKVLIKNSQE